MHEKLYNLMTRRAIIVPSAEIYKQIAGFYDYGPTGFKIKKKIENLWRNTFVKTDNCLEIDGSNILPEKVFQASGHASNFDDPMIECLNCKKRHRADHLIKEKLNIETEGKEIKYMDEIIKENKVKCPYCGGDLNEVKPFSLMFKLEVGSLAGNYAYLRPETAQNIFINFNRIFNSHGAKLPMGIAQVGKAYRNEISPRNALIRTREFTQMEVEMFFDPEGNYNEYYEIVKNLYIPFQSRKMQEEGKKHEEKTIESIMKEEKFHPFVLYYIGKEHLLLRMCGIKEYRMRHLMPEETAHYSAGNYDVEIKTDFGYTEVMSLANRTDYDLTNHSKESGKKMEVIDDSNGRKFIPHVVEPSIGLDRLFWCSLEHAYIEDKERGWDWLDLPPIIAPYDVYVLPLMKKDKLPEKAKEICELLRDFDVYYDQSGTVGKRYAKADEIGVPYCITIDYETFDDESVTVRFRNDGQQIRIKISELKDKLNEWKREGKVTI